MARQSVFKCAFYLLIVGIATGCFAVKARPLESSKFLPHGDKLIEMTERAPFNGIYVPDPTRFDQISAGNRKVVVAPVNSEVAAERIQKSDLPDSIKRDRLEELNEMGRYLRERLKTALMDYQPMRQEEGASAVSDDPYALPADMWFSVIDSPEPNSVIFELALVEVVPTNPGVNAVATVGGFLVPGGGLVRLLGTGSVALEGIIRDGATGEVLFEFKDREADKTTPFSVKDYQMYAHARQTIDEWSTQLAEVVATPSSHMVDDALPVSLNPL